VQPPHFFFRRRQGSSKYLGILLGGKCSTAGAASGGKIYCPQAPYLLGEHQVIHSLFIAHNACL